MKIRRWSKLASLAAWLSAVATFCAAPAKNWAEPLTLNYRDKVLLSANSATDQKGASFPIAGLSGITWRGGDGFIAVMDNSNRLVNLQVTFRSNGAINTATVSGGHTLAHSRDFEGIAYTNASLNSVFLSSEAASGPPALYEYSLDSTGALLQTVKLPAVFAHQTNNRGLEALTLRADGREMWTANEEALSVDGAASTPAAGSVVRLQRFTVDGNTVTPAQQYAYVTDPIHSGIGKPDRSGLSDLVVLPDGTLLALERSAIQGVPTFATRIYQINVTGATDVSQGATANGLAGQTYKPVAKTLLFDSTELNNRIGENLEGLCLGPKLASGNWVLLGVVDNGDPISKNTLVAFELITVTPLPLETIISAAGGAALLVLLTLVVMHSRRRHPS